MTITHLGLARAGARTCWAAVSSRSIGADDVGVGPMPGPDGKPGALIGGASLWPVDSGDDVRTAATWDFLTYLVGAEQQSEWAAATGYMPGAHRCARARAVQDHRGHRPAVLRRVRAAARLARRAHVGRPGGRPAARDAHGARQRRRRASSTAPTSQTTLDDAANQANGLIADYNARN